MRVKEKPIYKIKWKTNTFCFKLHTNKITLISIKNANLQIIKPKKKKTTIKNYLYVILAYKHISCCYKNSNLNAKYQQLTN